MQVAARFAQVLALASVIACGSPSPDPQVPSTPAPAASAVDPGAPSTTSDLPGDAGAGTELPTAGGETGRRREDIQAAVQAKRDQARACYDTAQKTTPTLEGDIAIAWVIDPQGVVADPKVEPSKTTIQDAKLGECIIGVIKTLKFPASAKGMETRASYPFNFHPKTKKSNTGF